jgi:hypothetical protein
MRWHSIKKDRKKKTFKRYRGIKRKILQRATRSNVSVNMQMKIKKMDERHEIIACYRELFQLDGGAALRPGFLLGVCACKFEG